MASMQWGRRAFLIELLFSMVALGICAAICLAGFARADAVSRESRDLSQAVIAAQSAAEAFKSDPAAFLAASSAAPNSRGIAGANEYFYDSDWRPCETYKRSQYVVQVVCAKASERMYTAQIHVYRNGMEAALYTLAASQYQFNGSKEVRR